MTDLPPDMAALAEHFEDLGYAVLRRSGSTHRYILRISVPDLRFTRTLGYVWIGHTTSGNWMFEICNCKGERVNRPIIIDPAFPTAVEEAEKLISNSCDDHGLFAT